MPVAHDFPSEWEAELARLLYLLHIIAFKKILPELGF